MDPIEQAVKDGEDRAEREWLLAQGGELPDRLKPDHCQDGVHLRTIDSPRCVACGSTES